MSNLEARKAQVRSAAAALGRGDVDAFLADASEDFVFTLAGEPPGGNTVRGKAELAALLKGLFGSKLERGAIAMEEQRLIGEGDVVVEEATGRARTLEGRDYNNVYCRIWRFRGRQIAALTEFMDTELARSCLWR